MKHPHLLISLILTFIISQSAFATETFLYTFTSNPFPKSINLSSYETPVTLLNRTFHIRTTTTDHTATTHFVPGRGLAIASSKKGTAANVTIYTKTANPTTSVSITLETTSATSITFSKPGITTGTTKTTQANTVQTLTHTYSNNTIGPKVIIDINIGDTIYIRSIECSFGITPSSTLNLSDGTTTLFTSSNDSTNFVLPTIIPADSRFSFYGWTASSTPITNSSTAHSLTTAVTSGSSQTLYASFVHHLPASAPSILTIIPSTRTSSSITETLSLPANALLASLHFHIANSTASDPTSLSISSDHINSSSLINSQSTKQSRFHKLDVNTYTLSTETLTLTANRFNTSLTIDSIVAIYYTQTTPRFYSSIPSFTDSHNLTIDFPRTINPNETLTAIDALTYSMTIDDSRFYFFSLPFSVPFNNITIEPLSGPHPRTYYYGYDNDLNQYLGDYVISDYDEATRSWRDLTLSELQTTGLIANHGYTIGLTKSNTQATITFRTSNATPDTPYTITTTQPETTLPTPLTNPSDTRNSGWHLIGNPFLTPLSPSSIYTSTNQHLNYVLIPNTHNTSYTILSPYSETSLSSIPPFTSFFIQALTDSTLINHNNQSSIINHQSSTIYHFNIVCETPDSITSTLTILSSPQYTENYEPGADLKSLSPSTDITHDGLAIYASNLTTGDTITISTPDNATLSLGRNILIPDNWTISIEDNYIIISDNTPSSTPDILDNTLEDDPVISIHTIDGRQLPLNTTLHPGIYVLRYTSGRTSKTLIK